ncbi:MAG: hypothetical protein KDH94_07465, partial [Coxiellaceae bacterium]|nr:hypothetical protein [Coxiellaceae bacterium]
NPNQYDTEFRTPLEVAVLNNRYESAKVLLLYGAYPFGFGGRRASVIAHQASAPQLVTLLTAVEGVYRYIVLPTGRSQTLFREDPFIALRTLDPRFFVFLMNAFVYETARFNLGGEITPDQIKRNIMSHPAVQRLYDQVEDEEIPSSMYYVGR